MKNKIHMTKIQILPKNDWMCVKTQSFTGTELPSYMMLIIKLLQVERIFFISGHSHQMATKTVRTIDP